MSVSLTGLLLGHGGSGLVPREKPQLLSDDL